MDEADKYKQRLEAIAEKRRLQEEQERARREMEEEKLRIQQLKRKSLRDQWLMEGAPLSPTSPDAQSPRSPLLGSQAQDMEKRIDKLQSEGKRLPEEEEKLKEQMENGQTEAAKEREVGAEIDPDAVVQNGENDARGLETTKNEVKTNQSPLVDTTATVLTNGGGEADTSPDVSEESIQSTINGQVIASESVDVRLKEESMVSVSEGEPGPIPTVDIIEEEEGRSLVMRAERVIVTDEDADVPEDLVCQEEQLKTVQSEETPQPNPEAGQEGEEAVEEVIKTEAAPEMITQTSEAAEPNAGVQPAAVGGDVQGGVKTNAEGQEEILQEPTSVQVQPPAIALEGTRVSSVPVYCQSTLTPELEAEGAAAVSPEGAETALKARDPAPLPGRFHEVPLADPQENQRTEARPGEQEPLLLLAKAPDTHTEPAAANISTGTETHSPTGISQGEEKEAPKRKTCQCCTVM